MNHQNRHLKNCHYSNWIRAAQLITTKHSNFSAHYLNFGMVSTNNCIFFTLSKNYVTNLFSVNEQSSTSCYVMFNTSTNFLFPNLHHSINFSLYRTSKWVSNQESRYERWTVCQWIPKKQEMQVQIRTSQAYTPQMWWKYQWHNSKCTSKINKS